MSTAVLAGSYRVNKRYMVTLDGSETIHFGQKGGKTFIDHGDARKKKHWIARHSVRSDFQDVYTAGFWAKHLLWNKATLEASMRDIERAYGICVVMSISDNPIQEPR